MMMLSIDPGTRVCGAAWWRDGMLEGATVVRNPIEEGSGPRECASIANEISSWWTQKISCSSPDVLALEVPQIYARAAGKSKGDPNKIMPLFGIGVALAALLPRSEVRFGVPHDWKGGVKKPKSVKDTYAIEVRVLERLSMAEQAVISWPTNGRQVWDVVDAIGIGLHHLGRFERHRVLARQ